MTNSLATRLLKTPSSLAILRCSNVEHLFHRRPGGPQLAHTLQGSMDFVTAALCILGANTEM